MWIDEEDGLLTAELPQWDVNVKLTLINSSQRSGDGDVYFNYQMQEDYRSVKLTRNDKDTFKNEGGIWVTAGDSRYSFLQRSLETGTNNLIDIPQVITQTINASTSGWSAQNPIYSWSNSRAGDTKTQHTAEMPQGNSVWNPDGVDYTDRPLSEMLPWNWNWQNYTAENGAVPGGWYDRSHSGNGQVEVNYTITDTDGAVAEAKYVLTLHDEWEHPEPDNDFSWSEAVSEERHRGESQSGWRIRPFQFGGQTPTAPTSQAKWIVSSSANFNVELKAETSANFGLADWFKASAGAVAKTTLDFKAQVEYDITPIQCGWTADPTASFQPVIRYKVRSKHLLLDHYLEDGRDINPNRNAPPSLSSAAPPSDGKWPKSGESEIVQPEAWWIKVDEKDGTLTNDAPLPEPEPTPTSPHSSPLMNGSTGQELPDQSETPIFSQPSGNAS